MRRFRSYPIAVVARKSARDNWRLEEMTHGTASPGFTLAEMGARYLFFAPS